MGDSKSSEEEKYLKDEKMFLFQDTCGFYTMALRGWA